MNVAQSATATAPWWGVPLIVGIATISGVVIAQVVTWLLDRRKSKWEDKRRWHADRRHTYATFFVAVGTEHTKIHSNWEAGLDGQTKRDGLTEVALRAYEVFLLASPPVRHAADDLFLAIIEFSNDLAESGNDIADRDDKSKKIVKVMDVFMRAARAELGVDE